MWRRFTLPIIGLGVLSLANISSAGAAEATACNNKMCRFTGETGEFGTVECAATANHPESHCTTNWTGTSCPISGACID